MHHDCFKNFEDLIIVDDKLPIKTAKIVSLKIFYAYGTSNTFHELLACARKMYH